MSKALTSPAALLKQQIKQLDSTLQPSGGVRIVVKPTGITTPDGKKGEELNVVILTHEIVNAYYSKPYDEKKVTPPDCFAHSEFMEGLAPIESSPQPQAAACAVCPKNEFGSAPNGKGKACRNSRLLAVLPADPALIADHPMWTISVPATSIKFYENYLRELRDEHETISMFVSTRVRQDPKNENYVAPRFSLNKPLSDEAINLVVARLEEARKLVSREPNYETNE